jgi:hypothetical protein
LGRGEAKPRKKIKKKKVNCEENDDPQNSQIFAQLSQDQEKKRA